MATPAKHRSDPEPRGFVVVLASQLQLFLLVFAHFDFRALHSASVQIANVSKQNFRKSNIKSSTTSHSDISQKPVVRAASAYDAEATKMSSSNQMRPQD